MLKETIKKKEHDIACYRNTFKRLYKSQYLFKKRYQEEVMYWNTYELQFNKYLIIDDHSNLTKSKQMASMKKLNRIIRISTREHENELDKKKKTYCDLQEEVTHIKTDFHLYEEQIQKTKLRTGKIKEEIQYQINLNKKLKFDYSKSQVDYNMLKGKILLFYSLMDAKEGQSSIMRLIEIRQIDRNLKNELNKVNRDITQLMNALTELSAEQKEVCNRIEKKSANCSYYIDTENNSDTLISAIKKSQALAQNIEVMNVQKRQNLQSILVFLVSYINQIVGFFRLDIHKATHFFHFFKYFTVENEVYTLNSNRIDFDEDFFHFALKLFCDFVPNVSLFFAHTFDLIAKRINHFTADQNEEEGSSGKPPSSLCFNLNEVSKTYMRRVRKASLLRSKTRKPSRESNKIAKKLDQIINLCQLKVNPSKDDKYKLQSSPEEIYLSYIAYLEKKKHANENVKAFFSQHPIRSLALISKYSNHLVKQEHPDKALKKIRAFAPIVIESKKEPPPQERDNSFDESSQRPRLIGKGKKKERFFLATAIEREKHLLFDRMNDLFNLELNYFKNREKKRINTNAVNEMFYHIKKEQERRKIESSIKRKNCHVLNKKTRNFSSLTETMSCRPMKHNTSTVVLRSNSSAKENEVLDPITLMPSKSRSHVTNTFSLSKTVTTNESVNTPYIFSALKRSKEKEKSIFSALKKKCEEVR